MKHQLPNPVFDDAMIKKKSIVIREPVDTIKVISNPDKWYHENWSMVPKGKKTRDVANLPHPTRLWACGKSNSGKGLVIKNLIVKADPPFERIVVLHGCADATTEWDDTVVDPETDLISSVPPLDFFDPEIKNLFIIDDFNLANLDRDSRLRMDRFLGFVSTHGNVSIWVCHQDLLQSKVSQRRMMNVILMWRMDDQDTMTLMARKMGLRRKYFTALMKTFKSPHDFIMWDGTTNSPMPLRVNLYNEVVLPEDDDE